jgi:hypothetical protein
MSTVETAEDNVCSKCGYNDQQCPDCCFNDGIYQFGSDMCVCCPYATTCVENVP